MAKNTNMFAEAAKKRETEQAEIKKTLGMKSVQSAAKKKVRMDLTVTPEAKEKLMRYAESKGLTASAVIQMLIDERCTQ